MGKEKYYELYSISIDGIKMVELDEDKKIIDEVNSFVLVDLDILGSGKIIYGDGEIYTLDEFENYIID